MAIGRPINLTPNIASKNISVLATAGQTSFTVTGGYRINEIAVYRNGTRLVDGRDFTATDGSIVTLVSAATLYDVIEYQIFDSFNVADAVGTSGDSTINGNLTITGAIDVDGHTELDDVNVSGAITATTFTGNLTGTAGGLSGSPNITINNLVGVAATFSGVVTYEDVTNIDSVGIITAQSGLRVVGGGLTVTGVSTFFSNVGINTDSPTENLSVNGNVVFGHDQLAGNPGSTIGIATVRGHHVNSDADYAELYFANSKSSGGSTASIRAGREGDNGGNNLTFYTQQSGGSFGNGSEKLRITSGGNVSIQNDSGKFTAGASDDLQIYHNGSNSFITDAGTGHLQIDTNDFRVQNAAANETILTAVENGSVDLYYDNSRKFQTTSSGIIVTGICTATSFKGDGSGLSGVGGDTDITSCLFI